MIAFPNAKINIGLQITARRPDGYHDLESIFYPIRLHDILEITDSQEYRLTETGFLTGTPTKDNLCTLAWEMLRKDHPKLPAVNIHLHKAIPSGAGMGGGSSDASFCLNLLNKKYKLGLSDAQLSKYAMQLGSDCPFFLINTPCIASGKGERLEEIELSLTGFRILIVNPGIAISTASVFSKIKSYSESNGLKNAISEPVETWRKNITNDLEIPVFEAYPEIASIKAQLYTSGAVYASMTGSGSTVFALFDKDADPLLNFPTQYFQKWV